ncbi:latrophilin Cirl-like isoform X3 [Neocloeon triangulifer]|uniref:latrophilin Cirl-like isoform X3 n=1 Tax=Neocloeon triangulifer TaxID=2078957 RepID=UPI00286F9B40|nr:latrophilin Cirl-like isoform X3 [Neocloeon triangulifer]
MLMEVNTPHTLLFGALFLLVVTSGCSARSRHPAERMRYDVAYECEGSMLTINCPEGEHINLIRANYGRFSITLCNDNGNTDWSVNCMSPRSLRVLYSKCSNQQNCSILASTSVFGDPCPGTRKYLEAHYQCVPAVSTSTTLRPSPPWLVTSQPSVWSTAKLPSLRPAAKLPSGPPAAAETTTSSTAAPAVVTTPAAAPPDEQSEEYDDTMLENVPPPVTQPPQQAPVAPEVVTTTTTTAPTPSSTVATRRQTHPTTAGPEKKQPQMPIWENDLLQYCAPATARNINWNWTQVGDTAIQPCPGGTTGQARWRCIFSQDVNQMGRATWEPGTPDLSECRSVWVANLESSIKEGDSIISIADDLSQVTINKMLYGGDLMTTSKIIKKMAQKISQDIQTFPDQRQREALVSELLHKVVITSSNLLDDSQQSSWKDLGYDEQMRIATSLMTGLEENAFLLANTMVVEKTVDERVKNVLVSVRVLETRNVGAEQFPSPETQDEWLDSIGWLELPRGALLENSESGLVRLVFMAFDRLEDILQPRSSSSPSAHEESTVITIAEETSTNGGLPSTSLINSKIISASLSKGRHIQLSEPVRMCLKHIKTDNVSNPSCVFWDYTISAWSSEGCEVEMTNRTHTVCKCDHLTNFAILMDVHATLLAPTHEAYLRIITYVGCTISIVFLIMTILTFQFFRNLKSDRATIHKNLCFCLLIGEIIFLAGIGQTDKQIMCGVVAGLLHYFFLCAFAWMFLEGYQLYVMLVEVFEAEKPRIKWYYIIGYGAPLIIVVVSSLVDPMGYGTDRYCWLNTDNYFIWSFVGPVIAVILANLVFLSMAVYKMCRHSSTSVPVKSKEHARLASARSWLRGAIALVFLLGLTWTFGLLFLNKETAIMAYVFTVLNSFQGLFIFAFHCVQNEKVQKEYRKFVKRNSWLPCSSSSSGKEQTSSFYAGSNGNPSAPNSHSTDSSALSPHGNSKISFKSYNGRVDSEPEDSPRSLNTTTLTSLNNLRCLTTAASPLPSNNNKDGGTLRRVCDYSGNEYTSNELVVTPAANIIDPSKVILAADIDYGRAEQLGGTLSRAHQQQQQQQQPSTHLVPHLLHHQIAAQHHYLTHGGRKKGYLRSASPWNHTYTEIRDGLGQIQHLRRPPSEDDPVYEEIERNTEIQVSDMSDEDGRRQSDMSRQSSRSYSDHRPLIPYGGPQAPVTLESLLRHNLKEQQQLDAELMRYRVQRQQAYLYPAVNAPAVDANARTVAFLEGETVVCHLQPEAAADLYNPYRTMVISPYSEC